jgi:hypothetical protein
VLELLDPLEVGDDHTAGVRQHVGHDHDALVVQDLVPLRRNGTPMRPAAYELGIERVVEAASTRGYI